MLAFLCSTVYDEVVTRLLRHPSGHDYLADRVPQHGRFTRLVLIPGASRRLRLRSSTTRMTIPQSSRR